MNSVTK